MTKLSNGREVIEEKMTNGATNIEMADGGKMSESEWEEYCAIIRALSSSEKLARLANRKLLAHAAIAARSNQ